MNAEDHTHFDSSAEQERHLIEAARRQAERGSHDGGAAACSTPDDLPGYELVCEIRRGGQGTVWEAEQLSTGRRVAVKLLLERTGRSEAGRRRFEREVELVARLQHPHIVSVIDSGIHQGRYYYVMDYVEGGRLDESLAPGTCEVHAALHIISLICDAVDFAHQRGVLHRDLKPSNILIDERGDPRLLDFGLAKA
ncbi:MAG: serine/threonine protein kinase, partial [bacterium]|nr:serine/threonine protein kinase [bacterium]